MKVLVTGANGQVGRELVEHCRASGDDVVAADRQLLDVTDGAAVDRVIAACRPDAIVHAAAWTAVDACESDPDRALLANAISTGYVARAAHEVGAHLVYLSTDYVFDGTKVEPYNEQDPANPLSVYGQSKLAGEQAALTHESTTVVRTSWVCGRFGANFVKTVLRLCAAPDPLAFVGDQRGQPTVVADLVPMVRRLADDRRSGCYHVTNQGPLSWFEFARLIVDAAGENPERVRPITTDELRPRRPAPRPKNSVLENAALVRDGLPALPHHDTSVRALVRELLERGEPGSTP